ncbi:MAG: serine/threonine-protein kinase [Acidobacteriota bacterium]
MSARYETAVPIGSGGISEVMKAWDASLDRWVALKFLRSSDPEHVTRLQLEARAQARVEHPNIARIYEVGTLDGRPYIAMQLIEGETLDRAAEGLPLEQRVELLRTVAEAAHAAHRVGLIHRDLKPSNVMVETTDDGARVPWVLDFGIAREHSVGGLTVTGQALGTPGYMAPEQARGETTALDRRADVFSLGVMLYELLGSRPPFDGESAIEVILAVLQNEPPKLRTLDASIPEDLETIVARCLEKEPQDRYASARKLAEDLGRWLDGEPVHARPVGFVGRLQRLTRRHPVASGLLAGAAALILLLAAGLALGAWQSARQLERERNQAVAAREEAEEVASFLVSLFETNDPDRTRGQTLTARELLERGGERVADELADRPAVRGRLLETVGRVERKLGLFDASGERLDAALAARRAAFGPRSLESTETLHEMALLRHDMSDFPAARAQAEEALAIRRAALGSDDPRVADSLVALANAIRYGRLDGDFLALYREALAIHLRTVGADDPRTAWTRNYLALALSSEGLRAEAEEQFTAALAAFEAYHGPDHPTVAMALHNFGSYYGARDARSLAMLERALEIRREVLGAEHPHVAYSENNLGMVLSQRGRWRDAHRWFERAHATAERARLAPDNSFWAVVRFNRGEALGTEGLFAAAEPFFDDALVLAYELFDGEESIYSATILLVRAKLLRYRGAGREAEAGFERAERAATVIGASGTSLAVSAGLGRVEARADQGRLDAADALSRDLYDAHGAGDGQLARSVRRVRAEVLLARGEVAAARALLALSEPIAPQERRDVPAEIPLAGVDPSDGSADPSQAERFLAAGDQALRARVASANGDATTARERWLDVVAWLEPMVEHEHYMPLRVLHARALLALGEVERGRDLATAIRSTGWRDRHLEAALEAASKTTGGDA